MPDIKSIVRQMIEDGESEDVIDAVVKKMQSGSEIKSNLPDMSPEPPPKDEYTGPDSFWGGVKNSLFGKEFDETARKSLKGFAEGTADIPTTLADTAQGFASGVHSLIQDPAAHFRAMPEAFREMGRGIRDVTKNAGADPEAFGHLSGQLFGQPAFTEGLIKAPAIAKATTGAINRIPAVNKTLSSIGSKLEGTRQSNYVPSTSRGLVAGAVRGVARPVGRALSRVGERGRLDAGTTPPSLRTNIKLKGETESPHSPDSDIFAGGGEGATRPRPIRHDTPDLSRNSEFTRPILETAEELAARKRPSLFTGGQSSRNRHRPYEPGQQADAIAENAGKPKATPPVEAFEPSIDPANKFSFEDLALMKSRREEVNNILRQMADENVDTTTGEITPSTRAPEVFPGLDKPKRTQGKWGITRPDEGAKFADNVNEEMGYFGGEQNSGMIDDAGIPEGPQRFPGDEAFDLGELNPGFRNTQSMPDWGSETIPSKRPVNPLRPEVPPGQVTNRQMFERSELRGLENRQAGQNSAGRQFADSVAPHEFDQDMMLTPDEFRQPDVPEFTSPFENQNDPRISGLAPRADAPEIPPMKTITPEEWGDWGGLEKDIPTLVPDASGSHVAAPKKSQFSAQANEEAGFFGPDEILDTANDSGILDDPNTRRDSMEMLNDVPNTYPTGDDIHSPQGRRARYDYNAARVSPENRRFIDQLPDDALEDFINRQSRNPNYMDHDVGRDLVYHASDTQAMRASGDLIYESPEQAQALRRPIVDWNNRGGNERFAQEQRATPAFGDSWSEETGAIPQRRRAPERDIRYDEDTQQFYDRNAGYSDDVFDATPEEMARARGIIDGSVPDPQSRFHNEPTSRYPSAEFRTTGKTLDEVEKPRTGRGRERLTSLFGEERAGKLASGERDVATQPDSQVPTDRPGGRKRVDDSTRRSWNSFERSELSNAGHDITKPGLTVVEPHSYYPNRVEMHYRDPKGKPIGILRTNSDGTGITAFAVDSSLGLGRGKIVFKLLNEAFDRGITEAAGSTSDLTRNLIERVQRLIKDSRSRGTADDTGMFGNSELELEINKIMDGAPDEFNTQPNESMGFSGKQADSGTANDSPKPVREVTLQGKKFPVYSNEDFSALRQQYEIRPAYLSETMPPGGKPKDLIYLDMGNGENRPHKIVGPSKGTSNDTGRLVGGKASSRHPTAERWEGIVKELEARNAPDSEYRDILSTGTKDALKKGQTWKSKVQDGIKYYDEVNSRKAKTETKTELFDHRVTDPNGKHLGDIVITEKRIKALQEHPVFKDMTREQVIEQLHGAQLETILSKAKIPENARTRVKVEPIDYNTNKTVPQEIPTELPEGSGMYKIQSQEGVEFPNDTLATSTRNPQLEVGSNVGEFGAESLTDFSGSNSSSIKTKPSAFKTSTKVEINPDVDFGPGGDIGPIVQEARRLISDQAVDTKYRSLLPKIMRDGELGPGETYRGKLERLVGEIQAEQQMSPEAGAQRLAEMDAFNESFKNSTGAEPPFETPLLPKFSKIDRSKLQPSTLNSKPEPWISPRVQQQFNSLFRTRTGQPPKKKKK